MTTAIDIKKLANNPLTESLVQQIVPGKVETARKDTWVGSFAASGKPGKTNFNPRSNWTGSFPASSKEGGKVDSFNNDWLATLPASSKAGKVQPPG